MTTQRPSALGPNVRDWPGRRLVQKSDVAPSGPVILRLTAGRRVDECGQENAITLFSDQYTGHPWKTFKDYALERALIFLLFLLNLLDLFFFHFSLIWLENKSHTISIDHRLIA